MPDYGNLVMTLDFIHILSPTYPSSLPPTDVVAMLMDPISFANRALQEMSEGLVSDTYICILSHRTI